MGRKIIKKVVGLGWSWGEWGWGQRADCFNLINSSTEVINKISCQKVACGSLWKHHYYHYMVFDCPRCHTEHWIMCWWPTPTVPETYHDIFSEWFSDLTPHHTISRVRGILQTLCPARALHRWGNRGFIGVWAQPPLPGNKWQSWGSDPVLTPKRCFLLLCLHQMAMRIPHPLSSSILFNSTNIYFIWYLLL